MSIEQFTIQPASNIIVNVVFIGLIVAGAVLTVLSLSSRIVKAMSSMSLSGRYFGGNKYVFFICGVVLIAVALGTYFVFYAPSTVTVGSGYINTQFSSLSPVPFIGGEKNVTSSEIFTAFVGQIGSGNFTLSKQYGANAGDTNVGVFMLGNGATAYVASTNSTNLIIQLNNGQYVILGASNTDALATSFSKNVYPLNPP